MISGFTEEDIEVTPHALFRLGQKQRKIYNVAVLKGFILTGNPVEICKQYNGNLAVIYLYEKGRKVKIVLRFSTNKIYIVTFYILNREQEQKVGK